MVFRPWDEWCHELSIYILLKTLHFSKICAMIYIQDYEAESETDNPRVKVPIK